MAIHSRERTDGDMKDEGPVVTRTTQDDATETVGRSDPAADISEPQARGGISPLAVVTGVLVAIGLMTLLGAVMAGLLDSFNVVDFGDGDVNVGENEALRAGVGGALILVIAQFVSYLWGGYTAGRMARGSGTTNGLLVAVVAVAVAAGAAAIAAALGANPDWPAFGDTQLPVEDSTAVRFGIGAGIASLVAMLVGAVLGGRMGSRWHAKLESAPRSYEYVSYEPDEPDEPVEDDQS